MDDQLVPGVADHRLAVERISSAASGTVGAGVGSFAVCTLECAAELVGSPQNEIKNGPVSDCFQRDRTIFGIAVMIVAFQTKPEFHG